MTRGPKFQSNPLPPLWNINWKVKREFWSFNPPLPWSPNFVPSLILDVLPVFRRMFQHPPPPLAPPFLFLFFLFFFIPPIRPRLRNTWKISLILARPLACLPGEITHLQTSLFWEWKFVSTVTTCYYDFAPRTVIRATVFSKWHSARKRSAHSSTVAVGVLGILKKDPFGSWKRVEKWEISKGVVLLASNIHYLFILKLSTNNFPFE